MTDQLQMFQSMPIDFIISSSKQSRQTNRTNHLADSSLSSFYIFNY